MPDPVKIVVNAATPEKIVVNQGPITIQGGSNYTLPAATNTTLGGIIVGGGLAVTGSGVLSSAVAWGDISGKPTFAQVSTTGAYADLSGTPNLNVYLTTTSAASTYQPLGNYANAVHTHAISDVTGLQTALDGKQASGSYVLTTDSRLSDARTPLAHTQAWSTITGTPTTLAGYGITDGYSSSNPSGYITASALTGYLTTATAAATYATISSLTSYLTTATASTTYTPQTRTIAAGTGLSGGGDLSANRTLSLAASGVTAGSYGTGSLSPTITVDAYGRVTSASQNTIYVDWNAVSSRPIDSSTGTAVFSMAANLADYELIRAKLKDYSETRATPAISAGSLTLDMQTGNFFAVSLNADVSNGITITNPPASGSVGSLTLELTATGTAYAINWGSINWPGGTPPTLTSASGKRDVFVIYTTDGGANWDAFIGGQNL